MIVVKAYYKGRQSKQVHNLAMAILNSVVQSNYRRTSDVAITAKQ